MYHEMYIVGFIYVLFDGIRIHYCAGVVLGGALYPGGSGAITKPATKPPGYNAPPNTTCRSCSIDVSIPLRVYLWIKARGLGQGWTRPAGRAPGPEVGDLGELEL